MILSLPDTSVGSPNNDRRPQTFVDFALSVLLASRLVYTVHCRLTTPFRRPTKTQAQSLSLMGVSLIQPSTRTTSAATARRSMTAINSRMRVMQMIIRVTFRGNSSSVAQVFS